MTLKEHLSLLVLIRISLPMRPAYAMPNPSIQVALESQNVSLAWLTPYT